MLVNIGEKHYLRLWSPITAAFREPSIQIAGGSAATALGFDFFVHDVYSASRFLTERAEPVTRVFMRYGKDTDGDGYSDRDERKHPTNLQDPTDHPDPLIVAGYLKCIRPALENTNDPTALVTLTMVFQNVGNWPATGVQALMIANDSDSIQVLDNLVGGAGRLEPSTNTSLRILKDTITYTGRLSAVTNFNPEIIVFYSSPGGQKRIRTSLNITNRVFAVPESEGPSIADHKSRMLLDAPKISAIESAKTWNFDRLNDIGIEISSGPGRELTNAQLHVIFATLDGTLIHTNAPEFLNITSNELKRVNRPFQPSRFVSRFSTGDELKVVFILTDSQRTIIDSAVHRARVIGLPVVKAAPSFQLSPDGSEVVFNVLTDKVETNRYQWFHKGVVITNATSTQFRLRAPQLSDDGDYTVSVANSFGTVTSEAVNLVIKPVSSDPSRFQSIESFLGMFKLTLQGKPRNSYRLDASSGFQDWDQLFTRTADSSSGLANFEVAGEPNGYRFFRAVGVDGKVNLAPRVTLRGPSSANAFPPGLIRLEADVSDSDGNVAKVEFFQNDVILGEADRPPYSFNWQTVNAGKYFVWARATDDLGAQASTEPIPIMVDAELGPPTILSQPTNRTAFVGQTLVLSIAAIGTPPLRFQWNHQGAKVMTGGNSAVLVIPDFTEADSGTYDLLVENGFGTNVSKSITVTGARLGPATLGSICIGEVPGPNRVLYVKGGKNEQGITEAGWVQMTNALSSTNFTIALWFLTENTTNREAIQLLSNQPGTPSQAGYALREIRDSDGLKYRFTITNGDSPSGEFAESNPVNTTNQWMQIAATYDGKTMKLFLNGREAGSTNRTNLIVYSTQALRIGTDSTSPGGIGAPFKGFIDEVQIWDRVLDQEEIRKFTASRLYGTEPNLVGYWSFDDPKANESKEIKDITPNGNHGTLQGSAGTTEDIWNFLR